MGNQNPHLWSPDRQPVQPHKGNPSFEPVHSAPWMSRRNGVGTILLGRVGDGEISPARVKLLWFTFFFVPVVPIRAYAVTGGMDGYYFHGEMGLWAFIRRYKWRVFPYLITVIVEAILRAVFVLTIAALALLLVAWLFGRL